MPRFNGRIFKHINLVGVELEGGWWQGFVSASVGYGKHPPDSKSRAWKLNWHGDGSVRVDSVYVNDREMDNTHPHYGSGLYQGEGVCDPPQPPTEVHRWMMHNYPLWVNDSCGMHVHMSFKNLLDYERIMEPEFVTFFEEAMNKWGKDNNIDYAPFWQRLTGLNRYCQRNGTSSAQAMINHKLLKKAGRDESYTKYYHLNFGAWKKYKTVECRLLPMFPTAQQGADAVFDLLWLFEKYLRQPYKSEYEPKTIRISEEMKQSLEANAAESTERILKIDSGEKETAYSIEESANLISDVVVRTTQDPNMQVSRLPDIPLVTLNRPAANEYRLDFRQFEQSISRAADRLSRQAGTITWREVPAGVLPVTESENVEINEDGEEVD